MVAPSRSASSPLRPIAVARPWASARERSLNTARVGSVGRRLLTASPIQNLVEMADPAARFGEPHLIRPRLEQGAFRVLVTDVYRRRCAVTHERTLPAFDAAHIRPYGDGDHEARNGLLLRRDIHSLFDGGYVTAPALRFEFSRRIKEEFENGRHYYALHGQPISAPQEAIQRPDHAALSWHNEHCFRR